MKMRRTWEFKLVLKTKKTKIRQYKKRKRKPRKRTAKKAMEEGGALIRKFEIQNPTSVALNSWA